MEFATLGKKISSYIWTGSKDGNASACKAEYAWIRVPPRPPNINRILPFFSRVQMGGILMPLSRRCSTCNLPIKGHARRDSDKAARIVVKIRAQGNRKPVAKA